MIQLFPDAYCIAKPGGSGPQDDLVAKKKATLKTEGNAELYGTSWDKAFKWYPYLFIGASKPESHIAALARIDSEELKDDAPDELIALLKHVQASVFDAAN